MNYIDQGGGYAGEPPEVDGGTLLPTNFATLAQVAPERAPVVVDGISRQGSVTTLVSTTKARKSFASAALTGAILSGGQWFGHPCAQGRVAIVDGELTLATLHFRLREVFRAMRVPAQYFSNLDIFDLRGRTRDCARAIATIRSRGPNYYTGIVVDPVYCFYPDEPGFSENDNAGMRRIYDGLIQLAEDTRAAITVVHHATKGDQSTKSIVDVGSGAGAIARAGDAHLVFRQHQETNCIVFDGVVRDFPEMTPSCWRWSFPVFTEALELSPDDLAGGRKKRSRTQEFMDSAPEEKSEPWTPEKLVANCISREPRIIEVIEDTANLHGLSKREVGRLLKLGAAKGLIHRWGGRPGHPARYATVPEGIINA